MVDSGNRKLSNITFDDLKALLSSDGDLRASVTELLSGDFGNGVLRHNTNVNNNRKLMNERLMSGKGEVVELLGPDSDDDVLKHNTNINNNKKAL